MDQHITLAPNADNDYKNAVVPKCLEIEGESLPFLDRHIVKILNNETAS